MGGRTEGWKMNPEMISIELTNRCAKACWFCYNLSRPEGASIAEMMQAIGWQQHSVRGFLAGTVKKKVGFSLTTSKVAGDDRRHRIETRRGR